MQGWGIKREGVIVVVSLDGNSDRKRGGGWPHGRGEDFARDVAEVGTRSWDRSIVPWVLTDLLLGVCCHSCY